MGMIESIMQPIYSSMLFSVLLYERVAFSLNSNPPVEKDVKMHVGPFVLTLCFRATKNDRRLIFLLAQAACY